MFFFFFFLTNKRATSSQLERSNKLHRLCHIWQDSSKHMFKEIFNSSMSSLRPKSVILQRTAYLCTYVFSLESVNFVAFSCRLTVFFFFCFLFSADSSLRVLYCFFPVFSVESKNDKTYFCPDFFSCLCTPNMFVIVILLKVSYRDFLT